MANKAKPPKIQNLGYNKKDSVKIATSNLFIETQQVPVDYMIGAIFNDIGGQEIINSSPNDLLTSSTSLPISNIADINNRYSSANILPLSDGILSNLNKYDIVLSQYVLPEDDSASTYLIQNNPKVYIDADYKNIVIELNDIFADEVVEVEILPYVDKYDY
jgi:hypothetical protein